jgi:Fe-Mn family superoxide dismutase
MVSSEAYRPQRFDLSGLAGISDRTLAMHFKLYEGYVTNTNVLNEKLAAFVKDGRIDHEEMPAYSELTRRLGFEYNGMVLHEYYFGNLKRQGGDPARGSEFYRAAEASFGSHEVWKADFLGVGKMRGVGWAVCYQDPVNRRLSNHWIGQHEIGNVAGFVPILVMDVWEHAYLLDHGTDRTKYVEAFFANVDWDAVERRLRAAPREAVRRSATG